MIRLEIIQIRDELGVILPEDVVKRLGITPETTELEVIERERSIFIPKKDHPASQSTDATPPTDS